MSCSYYIQVEILVASPAQRRGQQVDADGLFQQMGGRVKNETKWFEIRREGKTGKRFEVLPISEFPSIDFVSAQFS